jgi:hypothetical protein
VTRATKQPHKQNAKHANPYGSMGGSMIRWFDWRLVAVTANSEKRSSFEKHEDYVDRHIMILRRPDYFYI